MSLLKINGIEVPVAANTARLGGRVLGGDIVADDGSQHRARSAYMDVFNGTTRLLSPTEALAWRGLLEGRGHRLACDTDPDYTGTSPSAGYDPYTSRGLYMQGTVSRRGGYEATAFSTAGSYQALGSDAKFDEAIAIEANRTNLFPTNVRRGTDTLGTTTGFEKPGGGTLLSSTTYAFEGDRSMSFQSTSGGVDTVKTSTAGEAPVSGSTTYVVSFYARVAAGTLAVSVEVYDDDGGSTVAAFTFTSAWQRFEIAHTTEPVATRLGISANPQTTGTFYWDALQCELGTFATSWVGASTVAAPATDARSGTMGLSASLLDFRRQDDVTVMGWFNGPQKNILSGAVNATDAYLWCIGTESDGAYLFRSGSNGHLKLRFITAGSTTTEVDYATDIGNSAWHHVAVVLRRAPTTGTYAVQLFIDGASVGTATTAVPSFGSAPTFYVGRYFGSVSNPFNGIVDELVVLPFAITTDMIGDVYAARFSDLPRVNVSGDYFGEVVECLPTVTGDGLRFTAAGDAVAGFQSRNAVLAFALSQAHR